jgi:alpha-N-arabinofuranosidase
MKMIRAISLPCLALLFTAFHLHADDTSVTLDLGKPGLPVNPSFYGLMTEEINHSYDGGIYAELVQNRVFKDNEKTPVHWSLVQDGGAAGSIALDKTQPLNDALNVSLRLDVTQAGKRVGIANDGFWGIPVKPATTYHASFYAKGGAASAGPLTVSIESNDGTTTYAQAEVAKITGAWQRYTLPLTTAAGITPTARARLVISTSGTGTWWFDFVSLFPPTFDNRPNGNRIDIMQLLSDMNPKFLRMPGGNYLEGDWFRSRFAWKQTVGPLDQRPGHFGPWGYRSYDGLGLLEFLEWCEDIKMQPLLAVFAGYTLKGDHVEPGAALQGFVDDALDEIQYVTGDASTKWGAERARDGHPKPFQLTYVEVGNEDWIDRTGSYDGRFAQFFDAIRAKYPKLKIIATANVKNRVPDVVDEHFYRSPGLMEGDTNHYDSYSRSGPKIFVGEWATRVGAWNKVSGEPTPNMEDALSDAAWLTGLERNSDLIVMQCYAPLFVNVNPGARQWEPDLIGYDALNSYGSPSYYAQKLFSTHLGNKIVPITAEGVPTQPRPAATPDPNPPQIPTIFFCATRDSRSGVVYLKVVNTTGTPRDVTFNLKGAGHVSPDGLSIVLSSDKPEDTNTITEPKKYIPVTAQINGLASTFTRIFAPYSINVLQIQAR